MKNTPSMIGICDYNGHVLAVYCHYDGYIEHNGRILFDCYNFSERAQSLVCLGDLKILGDNIAPNPGIVHSGDNPQPDTTVAFHRDMGLDYHIHSFDSVAKYLEEVRDNIKTAWCYLFDKNTAQWYVASMEEKQPKFKRLHNEILRILWARDMRLYYVEGSTTGRYGGTVLRMNNPE